MKIATTAELKLLEVTIWSLLLGSIRGLVTFAVSLVHLVVVLVYAVALGLFRITRAIYTATQDWQPNRPGVFGGALPLYSPFE